MATISGALIVESLKVGASLEGIPLHVDKIFRADCGDESAGQPRTWTFVEFRVDLQHVDKWTELLPRLTRLECWLVLRLPLRGDETFVVFGGKVFRYPRGDPAGRAEAENHRDRSVSPRHSSTGRSSASTLYPSSGGSGRWLRCRLWTLHRHRPFGCVVRPPRANGVM